MSGDEHPMHPLVDADGHITATGAAFVQRAGEIMDETVASVSGERDTPAGIIPALACDEDAPHPAHVYGVGQPGTEVASRPAFQCPGVEVSS